VSIAAGLQHNQERSQGRRTRCKRVERLDGRSFLARLKQSRPAEYDAGGLAMLGPDGTMSGAITLSLSRDAATKLAR
jgi:hypothetical protein